MAYYAKPSLRDYILRYRKPPPQTFLMHHGIDGQKWGVKRGPPYPLSEEQKERSEKAVVKEKIKQYNNIVKNFVNVDVAMVFEVAKAGGRHNGVYEDAIKKKRPTLEKSIVSHLGQVEEHADKIVHPEKYDTGWAEKDERQRKGLLRKWEKDMKRNAEQAGIEIDVWKERFGDDT